MHSSAKHIGTVLKEIVKEHGWENDIASNKIPLIWIDILGEKTQDITEFKRFEEGKLYIHVSSAPWRNELTLRKQELISKINSRIGFSLVKDIIFR